MGEIFSALSLATVLIAAPGQGGGDDVRYRDAYRAVLVAHCQASARKAMPVDAPAEAVALATDACACTAERTVANKRATEIAAMDQKTIMAIAKQCMAEVSPEAAAAMPD